MEGRGLVIAWPIRCEDLLFVSAWFGIFSSCVCGFSGKLTVIQDGHNQGQTKNMAETVLSFHLNISEGSDSMWGPMTSRSN
jgi:hypothetical protein